ncbi:MAG TPA: hypothetical protein VIY48_17685 [Candidatus Paceibacterota bacterium]
MPYPPNVATVTVTATYKNSDGSPATGTVSFTPNTVLQDATASQIIDSTPQTVTLLNGSFSVTLMATDDTHLLPSGWSYNVVENIAGCNRNYFLQFPAAQTPVDLSSKAPVITPPATVQYVPLSTFTAKGDLVAATAVGQVSRLGVGTDGQFLTANSAQLTGLQWQSLVTTANVRYRGAWAASTAYLANDLITYAGSSWMATAGFTSGTSFALANLANLTDPPYHFDPLWYGAKGDGNSVIDGAMTAASAVLTSASGQFTAADVGKLIMVKGAGPTGVTNLVTTIQTFTSATSVTLAAAATTTVTGAYVLWATDDTAAFTAATNAAYAYATSHSRAGQVFVSASPGKFYGLSALTKGGVTLGNAQIPLPIAPVASPKVHIEFTGPFNQSGLFHWNQTIPQYSGATLVSFGVYANGTAQVNDINANGNPAIIGGPTQPNGYGTTALLFSNMLVTLRNLSMFTTFSTAGLTFGCFDFSGIAEAQIIDCAFGTTALFTDLQSPTPLSANLSICGLFPANGNNDLNVVRNASFVGGHTFAFYATEHTVIEAMRITYCWAALCVIGGYFNSVGASHAVNVDQISVEGCTRHVYIIGSGQAGQGPVVNISQLDTEGFPIIYDGSNGGNGGFGLGNIGVTGFNPPQVPNKTGIRVVNLLQQPGPVATPTFTLGVAFKNPYWAYAQVTIAGGTVTGISLGASNLGAAPLGDVAPTMQATGLTSGTFRIPPGGWITINGSVAPTTHTWVVD